MGSMEDRSEANFARNMAALRQSKDMSQSALARAMVERGFGNYSQMTVSRTEKGERPIRLGEARVIADILGARVTDLVRGTAEDDVVELAQDLAKNMQYQLVQIRDGFAEYETLRTSGMNELAHAVRKLGERSFDVEQAQSGARLVKFPLAAVGEWAIFKAKDDGWEIGDELTATDLMRIRLIAEEQERPDNGIDQAAP